MRVSKDDVAAPRFYKENEHVLGLAVVEIA